MCFPGYSGSKESLAGEPELNDRKLDYSEQHRRDNSFALHYARKGLIAVPGLERGPYFRPLWRANVP